MIFPSSKTIACSANVWLQVVGSLGETVKLHVPRGVNHFSFWYQVRTSFYDFVSLYNDPVEMSRLHSF